MAHRGWSLGLSIVLVGCGLTLDLDPPDPQPGMDAGLVDAGPRDADVTSDGGPPGPCVGAVDGETCGEVSGGHRLICLDELCAPSRCGDDFLDVGSGEECDDGNDVAGDGCEPFACVLTCRTDEDCADANPCNGAEVCDSGACIAGAPVLGITCRLADDVFGACGSRGVCAPLGCGNGDAEPGEQCDDGNDVAGDGCEADCTRSCATDADCADDDVCNGHEVCTERGCVAGAPAACPTTDDCHVGGCDPIRGCFEARVDADADGHSPRSLAACGDDCDDARPEVHAGAPEQCNGRDDDCDGATDEAVVDVSCHPDRDHDGFGDPREAIRACLCPPETTTVIGDCHDVAGDPIAALVRPDQHEFFATQYCASTGACGFDYDCNGREEPRFTAVFDQCRALTLRGICVGEGWQGSAPACGVGASWIVCEAGAGPGGGLLCRERATTRVQACR